MKDVRLKARPVGARNSYPSIKLIFYSICTSCRMYNNIQYISYNTVGHIASKKKKDQNTATRGNIVRN